MTAEQKEIRDKDLADAVHEAVRQLRATVNIAIKHGLRVTLLAGTDPDTNKLVEVDAVIYRDF